MLTEIRDSVLTVDFAIRSLARDADITMEELAAAEPQLRELLATTDSELAACPPKAFLTEVSGELEKVVEALRGATDASQHDLYEASAAKVGAGRLYDFTGGVLTVTASALVLIVALRVKSIEIRPDGKGLKVTFRENGEPLSGSLTAVTELIGRLLAPLGKK